MLGYDIGIVSEGDAFLNLAHPHFENNPDEIVYFGMHELHHVGYTLIHPIPSLSDITTTDDLATLIKFLTHMEGLAVYTPLQRRTHDGCFSHEDYAVLNNPGELKQRTSRFFEILDNLISEESRSLVDSDFQLIEEMSSAGTRLWYVTGAHMANTIDEELGRLSLIKTITSGYESFFSHYSELTHR